MGWMEGAQWQVHMPLTPSTPQEHAPAAPPPHTYPKPYRPQPTSQLAPGVYNLKPTARPSLAPPHPPPTHKRPSLPTVRI